MMQPRSGKKSPTPSKRYGPPVACDAVKNRRPARGIRDNPALQLTNKNEGYGTVGAGLSTITVRHADRRSNLKPIHDPNICGNAAGYFAVIVAALESRTNSKPQPVQNRPVDSSLHKVIFGLGGVTRQTPNPPR